MNKLIALRLIAGLASAGAIGACYSAPAPAGVVYVHTGPPANRVEVVPASLGTGYVWVGGHWGWNGVNYNWVPGVWSRPTVGFTRWVPGRWNHARGGWYWSDGYWR